MKRFLFVGEGLTDFKVLKNLFIGFFKDKNLSFSRLIPRDKEPVGWGNVLCYLESKQFQEALENADYVVVQIDTDKCEEWKAGLRHIGDDPTEVAGLVGSVTHVLIGKMGLPLYNERREKILFAITVHEIECWLLPFVADTPAHQSKMVGCTNAVERIAQKRGFSINQKNYEDGKHYEELSSGMKDHKTLMRCYTANPSLYLFINDLLVKFASSTA